MGNDGGSIPTRRELVKEAARNPTTTELKSTLAEKQSYHWSTDPLTNTPLVPPIVSDCTGILYNKDSILEFLLPSADDSSSNSKAEKEELLRGNVKSLKDIVEIKFTSASSSNPKDAKWLCPITSKPLGPGSKAVYLVPCGHAFTSVALKELSQQQCPECETAYAENDVIPIIPIDETDIARLALRIKDLKSRGLAHSLKKAHGSKKRKKGDSKDTDPMENEKKTAKIAEKAPANSSSNGIKNSATASLTARVLAEEDEKRKRQKTNPNQNLKTLFTSNAPKKEFGKNNDFMTRGYAVPNSTKK